MSHQFTQDKSGLFSHYRIIAILVFYVHPTLPSTPRYVFVSFPLPSHIIEVEIRAAEAVLQLINRTFTKPLPSCVVWATAENGT